MPIPIYTSSPITAPKPKGTAPKSAAYFDLEASRTPRTFDTTTGSCPSAQLEVTPSIPAPSNTPLTTYADSAVASPFASFRGFGEGSTPTTTIDEGSDDEAPPTTASRSPVPDYAASPPPSAPPTVPIRGVGDDTLTVPRKRGRARHSRRASYFTPSFSAESSPVIPANDLGVRRASEGPLLPSHNPQARRTSEAPLLPSHNSQARRASEAPLLPCHNSAMRRVSDAPKVIHHVSWGPPTAPDLGARRSTIAVPSPLAAPFHRPGPTPLPTGDPSGTDLSCPPGYRQNVHASEFSSSQRAAHEAAVADEPPRKVSLAAIGINDNEGVWDAARRWASFATDSFATAEQTVWKRLNKD